MKIAIEGEGWDAATEATVRTALESLAAAGVRDVLAVRYTTPRAEAWATWVTKRDGWSDGVYVRAEDATLADRLPAFLDELRRMAADLGAA